jgi:hypothetical protein
MASSGHRIFLYGRQQYDSNTDSAPQAQDMVGRFFDYDPKRYQIAFRQFFSPELQQPFIAALKAISNQNIPPADKYAAGQLLAGAALGASKWPLELLQGGTRRLTGETDNLALGYQTTADGFCQQVPPAGNLESGPARSSPTVPSRRAR